MRLHRPIWPTPIFDRFNLKSEFDMKIRPSPGLQLSFQASLEDWAEGMDYCAVAVPEEITTVLGTKGPVSVMARVNDSAPFQVSLFPVGGGRHFIRIKAKIRKETNTRTGDRVELEITVLDRANVPVPDDLTSALAAEGVLEAFMSFPPGKRGFIIRQIDDATKPPTRTKRIESAVTAAHRERERAFDRA